MALSFTVLDANKNTTDAASRPSASVVLTTAASRCFLAIIINHKASAADVVNSVVFSGATPGTWASLDSVTGAAGTAVRLSVLVSTDAAGTGTVTWDFNGATQTGFEWWVVQVDGCDDSSGGANLLAGQTAIGDNNTSADVDLHATFAGAYTAGNGVLIVACQLQQPGTAFAFEADYTSNILGSISTPNSRAGIAYKATNPVSTTVTVTTESAQGRMKAYEVKLAAGGAVIVGTSTSLRQNRRRRR